MDIKAVREDFPLLKEYGDIAYLDNAATTQKPYFVIEAEKNFYERENANPMRGLYELSQRATDIYEKARESVRDFINAKSTKEIVFTRNATESLNLLAYSYGELLEEGDEIAVTVVEHHSNLIPWQQIAKRKGLAIRWIECEDDGTISEEALKKAISDRTKIVAMTQISNVLGIENDIKKYARIAHEAGAIFVCDGAQSVPHIFVDVEELDVDFLVFSGHKMLGPMGIGVLYGKEKYLEKMPPFLFGGEMIEYVTREDSTWNELPHKFEAGTVNAAGATGLMAAIDYYKRLGFSNIIERENYLSRFAYNILKDIPEVNILGSRDADMHHGIFSFTVDGVHPHDIAEILSSDGICVRAGHHCAQVLMQHMKTMSTARASIAFYNTEEEIERFAESLSTLRRRMGYVK
ncbi:MAG: cysteine desulfurase [Lachnospiraceae bacterium]|nr:cysteine desulfurase [Lachnospiraceae bacterium]